MPSGWQSEETAGGADLRVASAGRRYLSAVFSIFATLSCTRTIIEWNRGSSIPAMSWVLLTSCLVLLALWCAIGDEFWRLERNCVTHRTGIGAWGYSKRYRNADLEIRLGFSTKTPILPPICCGAWAGSLFDRTKREGIDATGGVHLLSHWLPNSGTYGNRCVLIDLWSNHRGFRSSWCTRFPELWHRTPRRTPPIVSVCPTLSQVVAVCSKSNSRLRQSGQRT